MVNSDISNLPEGPWRILVVDDEHEVHSVTRLVLDDTMFMGRPISLINAYSAAEARSILASEGHTIACILLDVVMEHENAGLDLIRYIRNELHNPFIRIILRTGVPGNAPQERIILDYDINGYKEKSELSSQKLLTGVLTALRTYAELRRGEVQRQELQQSREFLQSIIDVVPSMLAVVNHEGRVRLWNAAAEQLTGVSAADAAERRLAELIPDLAEIADSIPAIIDREQIPGARKAAVGGAGGRQILFTLHPLMLGGERAVLLRGDDVTEQERKAQHVRRTQTLEAMRSLASGLAHDLNNILGGVIGALSLIECEREEAPQQHNGAYDPYLQTIKESSDRASGLVKQLLTFTRRSSVEEKPVSLKEVVERVESICRSSFDSSVNLRIAPVPDEAVVMGDLIQFEQMVLHLCVNGYQAMTSMRGGGEFPGGVLTLQVDKEQVAGASSRWCIAVSDTGVGIDSGMAERIFDPFFTTKENANGIGLSLAMVQSSAEQFGGEINMHSDLGKGTRIELRFPAVKTETGDAEDATDGPVETVRTVLVCDDEELMRRVAGRILERAGFAVLYASDGDEAVELYDRNSDTIDLVLMDLSMPGESGLDIFRRLQKIRSGVRVLFSSGYQDDERLHIARNEGAVGVLQKPYTMDKMIRTINRSLQEMSK